MIAAILRRWPSARHVLALMTGTAIAQALPIAISPILTRLYAPSDFGLLGLFASLTAIISIASTGRFELAIVVTKEDRDADALTLLAIFLSAISAVALLIVVAIWKTEFSHALGNPDFALWLYLVPFAAFIVAAYNSLTLWLNRHQRYGRMSGNRVLQSTIVSGGQLLGGALSSGAAGLIVSQLAAQIITTALLVRNFGETLNTGHRMLWQRMIDQAKEYRSHPFHLLPAHAIGTAAQFVPLLAISTNFGPVAAGAFLLTQRVLVLPTMMVSEALGDVYRQSAAKAYREDGQFRGIFLSTLRASFVLAIVPFGTLAALAPSMFVFVFGEPWKMAGDIAQILAISSFFQFIFTPVDKGAIIVGAARYIFSWHLLRLLSYLICFFVIPPLNLDIYKFILLLSAVNSALYTIEGVAGYLFSTAILHGGAEK